MLQYPGVGQHRLIHLCPLEWHKLSTRSGGSNGRPARPLLPQPKVRIRTWVLFSGANANPPGYSGSRASQASRALVYLGRGRTITIVGQAGSNCSYTLVELRSL